MKYTASDLKERGTLSAVETTTNEDFEEVEQLVDVATVWGRYIPQPGREAMRAEQVTPEPRAMWVMRYRDWVTERHVVTIRGRVYEIHSVVDVEGQKRFLELVLTRRDEVAA